MGNYAFVLVDNPSGVCVHHVESKMEIGYSYSFNVEEGRCFRIFSRGLSGEWSKIKVNNEE